MWFAGPCSSSATCPTSKDLLPATKGTTLQRTPITGPRFVPKVSTNTITPTRFTQSSVRVSPYTEDGNAYDATRWFIHFSIHALQFLIILHGGSLPFGGDKNLKIIALSFISTGLDRCACKEPLAPSTWTKCSSRHLPRLSTMWKVKQDPFFFRL